MTTERSWISLKLAIGACLAVALSGCAMNTDEGLSVPDEHEDVAVETAELLSSGQRFGPAGGSGGFAFAFTPTPYQRLKGLTFYHGPASSNWITGMYCTWRDVRDGTLSKSPLRGATWGYTPNSVTFADDEYITAARVYYDWYIDRLDIITNKREYAFGGIGYNKKRADFTFGGLEVHGFFGKSGLALDSIGFMGYTP